MGEPAGAPVDRATRGEPASVAGRLEVRISGSGGQGILLAAAVLAEAVAAAGLEVVQTQSYGPEARGGASQAEVIAASEPIDYPEVDLADISLCLSQAAFDKYAHLSREGALVLYDSGLVNETELPGLRLVGLPFTQTATVDLGAKVVANVVSVGALGAFIAWLPPEAVDGAVAARVPERFKDLNLRALEAGRRLVELAEAGVTIEGAERHGESGATVQRTPSDVPSEAPSGEPSGVIACEPCGDER